MSLEVLASPPTSLNRPRPPPPTTIGKDGGGGGGVVVGDFEGEGVKVEKRVGGGDLGGDGGKGGVAKGGGKGQTTTKADVT